MLPSSRGDRCGKRSLHFSATHGDLYEAELAPKSKAIFAEDEVTEVQGYRMKAMLLGLR